jgi:hypothetical protein
MDDESWVKKRMDVESKRAGDREGKAMRPFSFESLLSVS